MTKINKSKKEEIVEKYKTGLYTHKELAIEHGCCVISIGRVLRDNGFKRPDGIFNTNKKEIIFRYQNGETIPSLAKEYGINRKVLWKYIKNSGVLKPKFTFKDNQEELILLDYSSGLDLINLSKKYDIAVLNIEKLLLKHGLIEKCSQNIKHVFDYKFFDIIDTEEKAYWLGYLYADGCNHEEENKVTIHLQELDVDILYRFKKMIKSNKPLLFANKSRFGTQHQFGISFSSKHMSKRLAELGCVAAKSLILKFPTEEQVSNHLLHHFVRGYFDGDGCFHTRPIKNLESTVQIVSTTEFLLSLGDILIKLFNITYCVRLIKKDTNKITSRIYINGQVNIIKFCRWIYKDATIFLERKHQRYLLHFERYKNKKNNRKALVV